MPRPSDPLDPAAGCLLAVLVGVLIWLVVGVIVWRVMFA